MTSPCPPLGRGEGAQILTDFFCIPFYSISIVFIAEKGMDSAKP
jgi:hypothetical protein